MSPRSNILIKTKYQSDAKIEKDKLVVNWLMAGFALLTIVFILIVRLKSGSFDYYPWIETIYLILLGSWATSIGLTGKYKKSQFQNIYYSVAPHLKSGFLMVLLAGIIYYFFRLESFSRLILFGTILIFTAIETTFFFLVFLGEQKSEKKSSVDISNNLNFNIFGQDSLPKSSATKYTNESAIDIQSLFSRISTSGHDTTVQFLLNNVDSTYDINSVTLLSTTSLENINVLGGKSQDLLINLHNLNDIRRLNNYLIACHSKIKSGGVLVGCFLPLERVRYNLRSKMPKFIFTCIYPIHFLFYRVFPKLPKIRHIYFILTKGKNRVISKAEIFGRLSYCGFKIIAENSTGNMVYFIANKLSTISSEKNPSYGPIVSLKRVGLYGKIITIYKFRTMHPFSEFIQKDIFEHNQLDQKGKLKDDFRITIWGKLLRKLWVDEFPQLYNWVRGELTLVGVRALSEQYFSLYPSELQELRTQFKPGLVPPYYADLPKNFEEILESEKRYLIRKDVNPYSTDFNYLLRAFNNIIFHGARSA